MHRSPEYQPDKNLIRSGGIDRSKHLSFELLTGETVTLRPGMEYPPYDPNLTIEELMAIPLVEVGIEVLVRLPQSSEPTATVLYYNYEKRELMRIPQKTFTIFEKVLDLLHNTAIVGMIGIDPNLDATIKDAVYTRYKDDFAEGMNAYQKAIETK